jgi:hypothetical protein
MSLKPDAEPGVEPRLSDKFVRPVSLLHDSRDCDAESKVCGEEGLSISKTLSST